MILCSLATGSRNQDAEGSNALRTVLTVSKTDLFKKEARVKRAREKKRRRRRPELFRFAVVLFALGLSGCGSQPESKAVMPKNTPILKVAVFADGRLTVDGAPSSIEMLRESLRQLGEQHGSVWYYREEGQRDPPAIAMEVLKEVVEVRLPIRLSSRRTIRIALVPHADLAMSCQRSSARHESRPPF